MFKCTIPFYDKFDIQDVSITLEEFTTFSAARLEELTKISDSKIASSSNYHRPQLSTEILTAKDRRKDVIGHFVLRLVFCKSPKRNWFIAQEKELLRIRLEHAYKTEELKDLWYDFFKDRKILHVTNEDFNRVKESLQTLCPQDCNAKNYYKVPFQGALTLVRNRSVYLEKGKAYVREGQLYEIAKLSFQEELNKALNIVARALPAIRQDDRLAPLLDQFEKASQLQLSHYSPSSLQQIHPQQLDQLSRTSFPLCMRSLHTRLRETHHLKHMARLQYGLFLKGIGVSMEDAIEFWKTEFSKKMDVHTFEKGGYLYSIRHNYGKEGKGVSYNPYSCAKIITDPVLPTMEHGCPFRHYDEESFVNVLQASGLSPSPIRDLVELVKKQHFQVACRKFFELTHPGSNPENIIHPNSFFDESRKYYQTDKGNTFSAIP